MPRMAVQPCKEGTPIKKKSSNRQVKNPGDLEFKTLKTYWKSKICIWKSDCNSQDFSQGVI